MKINQPEPLLAPCGKQSLQSKQLSLSPSPACSMAECARGNFNAYLISISSKSSARQLRNEGERRGTRGVAGRGSVTVC